MSATNRGAKRKESDYYATPGKSYVPLLGFLRQAGIQHVHEPACGDGRIVRFLRAHGITATGADVRKTCAKEKWFKQENFLTSCKHWECVLTNPPFSLAQEFVTHALPRYKHVFMLLRLNFLGSQKRKEWWETHVPDALIVLSERPDFTGDGGDACEYAWFYWGPSYRGVFHV